MSNDLASRAAGTLLRLREGSGPRANLRRGNSHATEHYAYPYLAPLWVEYGSHFRVPLLRFGALAATASRVGNDPSVRLGTFLRRAALVDAGNGPDARNRALERTGRRLVWVQTGDVEKLHMVLRQLLVRTSPASLPVSWTDVAATYLWWDQTDPAHRTHHRRALLERFYGTDDRTDPTHTAPDLTPQTTP